MTLKNSIDKHVQLALKHPLIHSFSVGVYHNLKKHTFHYGTLIKEEKLLPSNDTLYEIASITKVFTGVLAAKAILDDKLSLNDDIRAYLPQNYSNLEYKGNPIQIKHLLTHTSGLTAGVLGFPDIKRDGDELKYQQQLIEQTNKQNKVQFLEALSKIKLRTNVGEEFNYSDAGSNLMGCILERVFDKPFQELITTEVLLKAKMNHTHFTTPEHQKKHLANGYLLNLPMPETNLAKTLWGAAGALKSNISDMLNFIEFQFKENNIVKESHRKLFEIDNCYAMSYYWWLVNNTNIDFHLRHDGGISRAKSSLTIFPERKIGIFVITNQSSMMVSGVLEDLVYKIYNDIKFIQ